MKLFNLVALTVISATIHLKSSAQFGVVDSTFNTPDNGYHYTNFNNKVADGISYPNGSYLVGGAFTDYNGTPVNRLVKLFNNGSIDPTFNIGTGPNGDITGITILDNNQLIIFGDFTQFDGVSVNKVVKLFPNGSIDASFQSNISPITEIHDIAESSNGDLIICGMIVPSGIVSSTMIKTTSSGVPISGFSFPVVSGSLDQLLINNSDDMFILGSFNQIGVYPLINIAKSDNLGTVYSNYAVPSTLSQYAKHFLLDSDSTLMVSSWAPSAVGGYFRTLANGSMDSTFNSPPFWGRWSHPSKDHNGGYFVHMTNNQYQTYYRIDSIGHIDPSFHTFNTQYLPSNQIYQTFTDPAGLVVSLGQDGIHRYLMNGAIDPTLESQNGANGPIDVVKVLDNGKIVIAGGFTSYNGVSLNGIARLMPDGSPDLSFNPNYGFMDLFPYGILNMGGEIRAIAVQDDGKILVGGKFNKYNNHPSKNLVRILPNGDIDTTFSIGNGISAPVNDILVRPDGKIMIGGEFYYYDQFGANTELMMFVGVLQQNGSPDPTTNIGSIQCTTVKQIKMMSNGQILLSGITSYDGQVCNDLVLINQDGTRDFSLSTGSGFDQLLLSIDIQNDDKIIAGGTFVNYNGQAVNSMVRLMPDGTLDATFDAAQIFTNHQVRFVKDGFNGKKYAIANLTGGNGLLQVVRLDYNGGVDSTFYYTTSTLQDQHARNLDFTLSSGIILGGGFTNYNDEYRNYIVRLVADTLSEYCEFFHASISTVTPLTCQDTSTIVAYAQDGHAPYLYSWDNGPLIENDTLYTNVDAGIHQLTVTDSLGCSYSAGYLVNGPVSSTGFDLNAHLVSGSFRPGTITNAFMDIYNAGCLPVNGVLSLNYDTSLVHLVYSNPAPSLISGDTLFWSFTGMAFDSTHLTPVMIFQTDTAAQVGDSLHFILNINPVSGDFNPSNNHKIYVYPVLNGYDPNDKQVYPIGNCIPHYINQGEKLTYTVRFQNTGNAEAINIHIIDSIPAGLDIQTLRVVASSHTLFTEVHPNNVIDFVFNNIHLVDSLTSPVESQGYVIYEIEQTNFLYPETVLKNKAHIYFDYNPAIITNEVINTIQNNYLYHVDTLNLTNCDSVYWEGSYLNTSGWYQVVYQNSYGCDSIRSLNLTLNHSSSESIQITGMDSVNVNNQTYTSSGTFYQYLTNSEGCDSILEVHVSLDFTGLSEINPDQIQVYPNPTTGKIAFNLPDNWTDAEFSLVSYDGRIIETPIVLVDGEYELNISGNPGIYFLKISTVQDTEYTVRIIKV